MGMTFLLHANSTGQVPPLDASLWEADNLSLEKSWHGLHFTLTGDAWGGDGPLAFLLIGGQPAGGDIGYGPARVMRPEEVLEAANALDGVSNEEFDRRFDPARLAEAEIYPQIWDEDRGDLLNEYLHFFQRLRSFVHEAARQRQHLVLLLV